MKKLSTFCLTLGLFCAAARADILAQWDFNTTNNITSPVASLGTGTASIVGGVSGSYVSGSGSTDSTPSPGNNSWSMANYPASTSGNKTAGVRFNVSTVGRENIVVTWDQRNSATGTRYARFQYTTDGTTFTDGQVITMTVDGAFVNGITVDLSAIPAVNNNPNFGFRILAEFESTATGSGSSAYVATKTSSTYGTAGTTRFDMMTISGNYAAGANTPPTISEIPNQTIRVNTSTGPVNFTVADAETNPGALTLSGTSSNPTLIPNGNITFGGNGANRTVTVTPAANQIGNATITIQVADAGSLSASTNFVVTVLPTNTPPIMPAIPVTVGVTNTPTPIGFTVDDLETPNSLNVTVTSSNPALLPNSNIAVSGAGANKTVTLTSINGYSGASMITVTGDDGFLSTTTNFVYYVAPTTNVLLIDGFDYADGSLTTNSGKVWKNHSGTSGDALVNSGRLQISNAKTEDVSAPLVGAPYDPDTAGSIFAKITFSVTSLPTGTNGDYFAHFKDSGTLFRGKVFLCTNNASAGKFRVGISAAANTASVEIPQDLDLNTTYTVVTRYNVGTARATLWLNPTSDSDPGTVALDSTTPAFVYGYAFRQNTNAASGFSMGTILIEDVVVANNFTDALFNPPVIPLAVNSIPVTAVKNGSAIQLSWETSNSGWVLQGAASLNTPNWQSVPQTINQSGAHYNVTIPADSGNQFFRLYHP